MRIVLSWAGGLVDGQVVEGDKRGAAGGAGGNKYCKAGKWGEGHGSFPSCLVFGSPPTICEVTSQCVVDEGA